MRLIDLARFTFALSFALLLAGAPTASAQDTLTPASELTLSVQDSEPSWLLAGIGTGLFLVEYLGELVLTAALGGTSAQLELAAIPIAGPWLELTDGRPHEWWEIGTSVLGGIAQLAGLTLLVVGLAWQRPISPRATVAVHPTGFAGGGGVGATLSYW